MSMCGAVRPRACVLPGAPDPPPSAVPSHIPLPPTPRPHPHPTSTPHPPPQFLAPEKLRGVGGILLNRKGRRFVDELSTRDRVTKVGRCTRN